MTEEVRKCVEILRYCEESGARCGGCPSGETNGIPNCHSQSHIADLIESLSAQLEQVTRERDAAVEDLRGYCSTCVFKKPCIVTGCVGDMGEVCKQCPCLDCADGRKWQWRGVEVE